MNKELLKIICCPKCKSNLFFNQKQLNCKRCEISYPIYSGIPYLISDVTTIDKVTLKSFEKDYVELLNNNSLSYFDKYGEADTAIVKNHCKDLKSFLELGCGKARNCIIMSKSKVESVVGLDISLKALLLAKKIAKKYKVKALFVCGDMKSLPFKKNSFDCCFGGGSLEHFPETEAAVSESYRVLKENGKAIFTVPYVSITTLAQGIITGNIPNVPVIKSIYYGIHHQILKQKYLKFGFEYSFTKKYLENIFSKFKKTIVEEYQVDYDLKYVPILFKPFVKKIIRKQIFWPMVTVISKK